MIGRTIAWGCVVAGGIVACGDDAPNAPVPSDPPALTLREVITGLTAPVYLAAPTGDDRLFVVEQPGRIVIVRNGQMAGTFLDITSQVTFGDERGLLSVAFHPNYAANGLLYVHYSGLSGETRVERYRVGGNPDVADPASAQLVLTVQQPFVNHNGGHLVFGPDGMLYIPLGDGGSGGDPLGHGQNRGTLLGALLRIDVDGGTPYAIPPDNPFVGDPTGRDEIWAYGLRNPWRIAFDAVTGLLYVADVGQNEWEEVNAVSASLAGLNYGWNVAEGDHCFLNAGCDRSPFVTPVVEYPHAQGCSIAGGFVYRGPALPAMQGQYFYGDFCRGWVRSFVLVSGVAQEARQWDFPAVSNLSSFGVDGLGELYVLSLNGTVFQIVAN